MGPNANKDGCSHIIRNVPRSSWKKYGSTQSADLYCVTLYIVSVTLAAASETLKVNLTVKQIRKFN